jgi:lipid II:glycine glycyltransferase (peptidoglycan interpeptide bridge formation enzyme)
LAERAKTSSSRGSKRLQLVRHGAGASQKFLEPGNAAGFGLPFSDTGGRYYGAVFGAALENTSFSFVDSDGCVATVSCDLSAGETLTRFGSAIEMVVRPGLSLETMRTLSSAILSELRALGASHGVSTALIRTTGAGDPGGFLAAALLRAGANYCAAFRAVADLNETDDSLFADLRSHHRRQVKKGKALLTLRVIDAANPDKTAFDRFRDLHAEVAGRVTRPLESWEEAFRLINEGEAALVFAEIEGQLVGGTLALDAGETSYYASGAYRRDMFDKPLSHFPLYHSFALARARGRRWFDVGDLKGEGIPLSEKEANIADFKAGFTSTVRSSIIWRLDLSRS